MKPSLKHTGYGHCANLLKSIAILASLATVIGCGSRHGPLHAPPITSSFEERRAAYEELAPVGVTEIITVSRGGRSSFTSLRLRNGDEVHKPEELLPVVLANSRTARAIRESVDARKLGSSWNRWGLATVAVSPAVGLVAGTLGASNDPESSRGLKIGVATMSAVAITGLILRVIGRTHNIKGEFAKQRAFSTYGIDLRTRLGICVNGDLIKDCAGEP